MTAQTLGFELSTEQPRIAQGDQSIRFLEITVRAPKQDARQERLPLNLAVALDRSGSMGGSKIAFVRQAVNHLLDCLQESDRLAIIAFDDKLETVASSKPITPERRKTLVRRLATVEARGSTALADGWLASCKRVAEELTSKQVNRVLLLTDGEANVGECDPEILAAQARDLAQRGVSTSTFGVGSGFNGRLLESMANRGSGNFYFIESPRQIPEIFAREFSELSTVTARDTEITLELPTDMEAEVLGGWHVSKQGRILRITLGDMTSEREQRIYVHLTVPAQSLNTSLVFQAQVTARSEDDARLEASQSLTFTVVDGAAIDPPIANPGVMERASLVYVAEVTTHAIELERQGQGQDASRMLDMALPAAANFLTEEQKQEYTDLVEKMKQGRSEIDRKVSQSVQYSRRRQR